MLTIHQGVAICVCEVKKGNDQGQEHWQKGHIRHGEDQGEVNLFESGIHEHRNGFHRRVVRKKGYSWKDMLLQAKTKKIAPVVHLSQPNRRKQRELRQRPVRLRRGLRDILAQRRRSRSSPYYKCGSNEIYMATCGFRPQKVK